MQYFLLALVLFSSSVLANYAPTVLISIDGLANHQFKKLKPKNLTKIAESGLVAEALLPVFPTKTFPNHLSIVTGKYPGEHGILHNRFFSRSRDKNYKLGDGKYDPTWVKAKPIWVIAEERGLKSTSYFWPESESTLFGHSPSEFYQYLQSTHAKTKLDKVLAWLSLPESERPKFITTYFSIVDSTNHNYGAFSPQAKEELTKLDVLLGEFFAEIEKRNINANIILVSDHGMTDVHTKLEMDKVNFPTTTKIVDGQTQLFIYEKDKRKLRQVADTLNDMAAGRFTVYNQHQFPEHWHLKPSPINEDVLPDIIVNAKPGIIFTTKRYETSATHGYDLTDTNEMEAIFIATGPNIKQGTMPAFQNIYVFNLLLTLLNINEYKDKPENSPDFIPWLTLQH
ncbi:alkaline phosphatase family protein [Thalassotalea euphylliae]|uniref:alkaline phosphatase family protein n=1 Tax=Thalassotalea euphylliae TaxID=1655234 RepID=UPI00363C451A